MDKISISQAVIVEGKYDKIKLSSILDAVIIATDGFRIFKDKETADLIRKYAFTTGIVILTDSDSAGFRIRGHIKSICPKGNITNIFIPDVYGKEKRKIEPSKEGKLGVEGIDAALLRKLFEQAGISTEGCFTRNNGFTATDLYELGLSGTGNSSALRAKVASKLDLPERITPKALLEAANTLFDKDVFLDAVSSSKEEK